MINKERNGLRKKGINMNISNTVSCNAGSIDFELETKNIYDICHKSLNYGDTLSDLWHIVKETVTKTVNNTVCYIKVRISSASALKDYSSVTDAKPVLISMQSMSDVIDMYGNQMLRLAYSYLHNMQDAEDILQEALIKYMQKAPEFESEEHRKAWLLRVTANLAKNKIDYNKVRETDELSEELISSEKEDLSFVWDAVKSLPVKYREVIHLYYEEGYQTADIAEILGLNDSTVRSNLKRGRDKLKQILKEEYDFE